MKSLQATIEFKGEDVPHSKYTAQVATDAPEELMGALMATIAHHRAEQEPKPDGD